MTWFLFVLINQAKYYAQDTGNQYSILGRLICLPDCDKTSENERLGPIFGPKKTQSKNHCKHFNSVLRTPTKFVLFSNQKVRKYVPF
jgi:hypothetical protein